MVFKKKKSARDGHKRLHNMKLQREEKDEEEEKEKKKKKGEEKNLRKKPWIT